MDGIVIGLIIALTILGALVGLNYLARNPRAEGRGWRVSNMLTRLALPMVPIGFVILWGTGEVGDYFGYRFYDENWPAMFTMAMFVGFALYLGGHLAILVSLLTRAWLRFAAYLRRVGPKTFAKNTGHLAWTVGKGGFKLYLMAVAALVAFYVVGLRNLAFLGLLKATLNSDSAAGVRGDRCREEGDRHADTLSAAEAWDDRCRQEGGRHVGAASAS